MSIFNHLKKPTKAPAMMVTPMSMLVYASRHPESKWARRMSNDMTRVEPDRKQSAPTCKNAENMFTCFTELVFLLLFIALLVYTCKNHSLPYQFFLDMV